MTSNVGMLALMRLLSCLLCQIHLALSLWQYCGHRRRQSLARVEGLLHPPVFLLHLYLHLYDAGHYSILLVEELILQSLNLVVGVRVCFLIYFDLRLVDILERQMLCPHFCIKLIGELSIAYGYQIFNLN